ncbi:MAG: carbon-nitrogen hydrolase [Opitutales bacterium]|nr:carbon-nitrogen hydrolase [Opitutales bacterium]MCH8540207.1 carbon-nitrogen hydrolase [Opitutales bacterium]
MKVRIALLQERERGNTEANWSRSLEHMEKAADQGAQIICLQELFAGPYPCQEETPDKFAEAVAIPGPETERLQEFAKRRECVVVASMFEKRAAGIFHNTAAVIDADGRYLGKYRKMHIPDDPYFYEKYYFTPGDLGYRTWETRYGKIGVLICWDQWFPEAARLTALSGAQILFYPTAIGWLKAEKGQVGESQWNAWNTIQRSHAVANGCYVASVNRVGTESAIEFWGRSFVADPYGCEMAVAGDQEEEILLHECDLGLIDQIRQDWPFFRDRRIDSYGPLQKRFLDND